MVNRALTFSRLRTKLTVLYGGLFAFTLVLISAAVLTAVSANARQSVLRQLQASGSVFERVWAVRSDELLNYGLLLSRDFGFRGAVATHDTPTIRSALANLKRRLGLDRALLIGLDGAVIDGDGLRLESGAIPLLQTEATESGVVLLQGQPYEVVSVPIGEGAPSGWLVFAARLDRARLHQMESLAAIPLKLSVAPPAGSEAAERGMQVLSTRDGPAFTVVRRLRSVGGAAPLRLFIQYPTASAMAANQRLTLLLLICSLLGLGIGTLGAGVLARSVTRPVTQLKAAVLRLQRGEAARVEVSATDEIGALADSFNQMAGEILRRERELEHARDRAEAADRAKSIFLSNMSHEVRTPLNGVIGVAGLLERTPLTASQADMLIMIQDSAAGLQRILDDVLDLARIGGEAFEPRQDTFDLGERMSPVMQRWRRKAELKGLRFKVQGEPPETLVVGDPIGLARILENLLDNAIKFTASGEISVRMSYAQERFGLEVADTGMGFDPAITEHLFEPFGQADGSMTRKTGGAGLGLSLCRRLARSMEGDLVATGASGVGATFSLDVRLPKAVTPPRNTAEADHDAPAGPARSLRVLVADDHTTNRAVARMILETAGLEVTLVEDGEKALRAVAERAFDLICMDMQMPVMDGLTANRAIRALEAERGLPRTPILMLSANALPEHVSAARASGADGHVAKPITPDRLINAIEAALAAVEADAAAGVPPHAARA